MHREETIRSASNPLLRRVRAVRGGRERGVLVLEGERLVDEAIRRGFAPEIVLVSAGFDAHARDPMASMQLSSGAFARFAAEIRALAEETCGGRLVLALEGGYDLEALGEAVAAVVETLAEPENPGFVHPSGTSVSRRLVEIQRDAHAGSWPSLCHVSRVTG